jgi:hypothetical protein
MSTLTSMSIGSFKGVAVALPPWTSILLRANHGVGKSKVIRQVVSTIREDLIKQANEGNSVPVRNGIISMARFKNAPDFFPVIDRRLSQMSEGDMVGLPSTDGQTTRFNPPDWYKQACNAPCALFLDELNRATPEVMQAAFQIVLDRELNGFQLHPLTRVYAAVNTGGAYTVNEMDPALLDRFFTVDLNPDVEEFLAWARSDDPVHGGSLHDFIPDFIQTTKRADGNNWLYGPKSAEPGAVSPSPRSWEMVHHALKHAGLLENPKSEVFYHICMGFLGTEAAIAFRDYCKSADHRITGEEIVNEYHQPMIRKKVLRLGQGRQNDVVDKVAAYAVKELTKLNTQQGENMGQLFIDLPDELKLSLWGKLTAEGIDKIDLAKSAHQYCAKHVMDCFGVPMGEAGIGIMPNIPGIFKPKEKK